MFSESQMATIQGGSNSWTWQETKDFETCLVIYPENSENRWENIASLINKTPQEVQQHYQILLDDIASIEAGNVDHVLNKSGSSSTENNNEEKKRQKGKGWTKEEHKQFLIGLGRYGKGDWKSIAKYCVTTRSSIQVASHAQKHFKRLEIADDTKRIRKRRNSIFDVTISNNGDNNGVVALDEGGSSNNGVSEQLMPTLVANETVPETQAPSLVPPSSSDWCVDEGVSEQVMTTLVANETVPETQAPSFVPPSSSDWCVDEGVSEQVMPALVANETVPETQAPSFVPPSSSNWCVDSEGVLDLGLLDFFDY